MRNLCWTWSNRSRCVFAAPPHITHPYSRIERTLPKYAARIGSGFSAPRAQPLWRDLIITPSALFAFATEWLTWSLKVSLVSSHTPRSRIEETRSKVEPLIEFLDEIGDRFRVTVNDFHLAGLRFSFQSADHWQRLSISFCSKSESSGVEMLWYSLTSSAKSRQLVLILSS